MMWVYCSGIILLSCLLVNADYKKGCLVDTADRITNWPGTEVVFYAYVLENDVVNLKITYEGLDDTNFFTTFYLSPSTKYSRRTETKYGEDRNFTLNPIEKANDWVQFNISSHPGSFELKFEPDTHELIPINQTSYTFKDLIIRASNISFCKTEKKWEVLDGNYITIPLGEDIDKKLFTIQIEHPSSFKAILRISNFNTTLYYDRYNLMIEKNIGTLQPMEGNDIPFEVSEDVNTIEILSKGGNFNVSVYFGVEPLPLQNLTTKPVYAEVDCPTCNDTLYISILTPSLVIFLIGTIIVGLGFKAKTLLDRIHKIKLPSKTKENYQRSGSENGNRPNEEQSIPLNTREQV